MRERHLVDVLAILKTNVKLVISVLKPSCHLKPRWCLADPEEMGQELAQAHACSCWGQSPGLPTYEPGLHCMSGKPGRNKPGREGSFSMAYRSENAEPSPRVLHPANLPGRLSLKSQLSKYMHTCTQMQTYLYTHTLFPEAPLAAR